MKLLRVEFEACVNLGNYEHEKIRLAADVSNEVADVDELTASTVSSLRDLVEQSASVEVWKAKREREQLTRELAELRAQVERGRAEYRKSMDFLIAQGLKKREDVAAFPEYAALLPHVDESQTVVECEIIDDGDDDGGDDDDDGPFNREMPGWPKGV